MLPAMEDSGFDTLKAARLLEAAGFESHQAEAMVTVFGSQIAGNAATKRNVYEVQTVLKGDMDALKTELKGDMDALKTELKGDMDTLQTKLDTKLAHEIGGLRAEFDASLKQEIGILRTELKSEIAEVRLSVESVRTTMYRLLLAQAAVIVSLILGLQRLL